jgi:hypothetical protein
MGRAIRIPVGDFGMIDFGLSLDDKVTLYMRGHAACGPYVDEIIEETVAEIVEQLVVQASCG